ncbi:glycoside hydrolase family 3 protein [Pseudoalteromonas sp. 10-33]|uniref:glycoside hydrolase family 3 protein n=1 Tax=Pseudoalteromonas sp. 10-33 TaxID=1761890 RepID=UPI00073228BD|nr:glycoside hydrolase family 3 N-terminal domain-containing protein [Pseudoalteromonas sp. 10-33]KTF08867.1 beta-glucosidase [Pseudoalteromonas sp. 10-33]
MKLTYSSFVLSSFIGLWSVNAVAKNDITLWPTLEPAIKTNTELETRITHLISQMSLEQKVGQMVQAEITWVTPHDVKKYHLGSVLNGGGTFLHNNRNASVSDWVSFMDELYLASMDTSEGGLAIPVTYGIDAVHGNNKFIGATLYPHNIGLGATRNPDLIYKIGEATAKEVLLAGIDWTFAPTLAVARDDRWGRTYESYSEDPEIVASYAKEMIEGLQGKANTANFLDDDHIYSTAKHWVGDGGTYQGIDQGDNQETESDLVKNHAAAYLPALKAGVQSIMASHNMWNGLRLHGSKYLLSDVLKTRLGFDGFIVGDWNSHSKIPGCTNDSCPQAVNAGLDMFMVVEDWKAFIENTVGQVKDGIIPMERIDDAVRRILRVKMRSGLFSKGLPSKRKYANQKQLLGAPEHKAIARQAVRESLVLLKNNNNLLPLNPNSKVLVAGDGAENMSKQTGGWTINWTGEGNVKSDFPGGTSIFDGIKQLVNKAGGKAVLSPDGRFDEKPDVAIVIFGENPYAEWIGDLKSIAYQAHSHRDAKLIESLKSQGIKVVSVFLSGRPLWVNREINASDSFVAAWLPGSEGVGVADVLFRDNEGNINFDFKGKLSFSWPKYASQVVLNRYDESYVPLFAYGFGLTYKDNVMLDKLSIENDFIFETPTNTPYQIMQGRAKGDWNYQLQTLGDTKDIHTPSGNIKGLSMIEADKNIQGDAKEFTWSGANNASVLISSSWYREDLSQYLINKSALTFDVRVETYPEKAINVQMGCGKSKCGSFDIAPTLKEFKLNAWQKVSIDLLCFANKGVEFERSSAPFVLTSEGAAKIRIADVKFEPQAQKVATIKCSE